MSFDTSTLWQNILSRDQRWAPVDYRVTGRSLLSTPGCQIAFKSRQQRIRRAKEIQKQEISNILNIKRPHKNPLDHIQSTLNEFKFSSTVCRDKFKTNLCKSGTTIFKRDIEGLASESNVHYESLCSARQRFSHVKDMFPKIKEHMKDISKKYFVAYREGNIGGAKGGYVLLPVTSPAHVSPPTVKHHLVTEAEMSVQETEEVGEDEAEADEEEEMKDDASPSEKSWQQAVKSRDCWVDDATISSLGKKLEGARSLSEWSGTHEDILSDNKLGDPGGDDPVDDRDALTITQPTSTTKDIEGSDVSPEQTEEPELQREKTTGSSLNVTDLKTDRSSAFGQVIDLAAVSIVSEVLPPPYICPSSPSKSQATRVKSWLRQSTFSHAVNTLPMM